MKSKSTAGLLALFLGAVGVHRFYLGQTGRGFLYLVFCWTFIPAIIALIDAIIFFTMDEGRFNEKYNLGAARFFAAAGASPADELSKLHDLLQRGVITQAEFDSKRSQLMR